MEQTEIPALPGMKGLTGYVFEEAASGFWIRGDRAVSGVVMKIVSEKFGDIVSACSLDGKPAVLVSYMLKDYSDYPEA